MDTEIDCCERNHDAAAACLTIWAFLTGTTGSVLALVYGIYALVPKDPFRERDIATGVCLIVFSSGVGVIVSVACTAPILLLLKCCSYIAR